MVAREEAVYCDCHGTEKMLTLQADKLIVRRKTHGEYHVLALPIDSIPKLVLELAHYSASAP